MASTIFAYLHNFKGEMTRDEVIKKGMLDYVVSKRPLYWEYEDSCADMNRVVSPDHVQIVRTTPGPGDELVGLGVVGKGYGIVQNEEVVDICEVWNEDNLARYVAAGAPNKGERIYVVMKTPQFIQLGPNPSDKIENHFFITSAHDGSEAIVAYPAPVHVRSGSILVPASKSAGAIKIKHTKHVGRRIALAKKVMGHLDNLWAKWEESAVLMSEVKMTDADVIGYMTLVLSKDGKLPPDNDLGTRKNNIRDEMFDMYHNGASSGMPYAKGTLLGAYLAMTTYADHVKMVRASKKRTEEAARLHAVLIGDGARLKAEALGFALQLNEKMKKALG
jgi:phage/plasmid-like protein (TIGR03299 family)